MLHKKEKLPLLKMLEKEVEKRKKHNKEGDKLLINTDTCEYSERVK